MSRQPDRLRARRPWAPIVQSSAFVRKELVEIVRQPRLLALLVVGPFALLLLFGAGYRDDDLRMRTTFVGPAGSFYEDAVNEYQDELARFVRPAGFTSDEAAARRSLADGDVDAVVVFPADPLTDVLAGEPAEVVVLHDKIDPIQETAIDIASRLAVQEVNARVVAAFVGGGQQALAPLDEVLATMAAAGAEVASEVAAGDGAATAEAARQVAAAAAQANELVASSDTVLRRLGAEDAPLVQDAVGALARVEQRRRGHRGGRRRHRPAGRRAGGGRWRRSPRSRRGFRRSTPPCWCARSRRTPRTSWRPTSSRSTTSRRPHSPCCCSTSR